MLIQIPETMPKEHYAIGSLNLLFFIIWSIILFIFGIIFIFNAKKQDLEITRNLKYSLAWFCFFYGATRVFFILMFHIEPDTFYNMFAALAYSSGMIGFTALIRALEKVKYKKNYFYLIALISTIITIGLTLIVIIFTFTGQGTTTIRTNILYVIYVGTGIAAILAIILYITLIKLSTGIVRKKALISFIGLAIMTIGIILDSQPLLAIESIPNWFKMDAVPLISILGFLIFAINQL
ncbi:MAG: hypothetical protein ACTSQJ_19890 [Promethearchaeota archaeon]